MPTTIVLGAMKCGTSALHSYLDAHPEVAMSPLKEVNFFFGGDQPPPGPPSEWWRHGQWHRGPEWYAAQFDAGRPVRGESSPGYTDPSHPEVAARMATLVPHARLLYLVRDPVSRAVSQWRHHVRDRTERRPVLDAVLDPGSQYVARSRYHERVAPFLEHFPADRLLVVVQERMLRHRRRELSRVYAHVGVDPGFWHDDLEARVHVGGEAPGSRADEAADGSPADAVTTELRREVWHRVGDDVDRLRSLLGDDLPEWQRPPG